MFIKETRADIRHHPIIRVINRVPVPDNNPRHACRASDVSVIAAAAPMLNTARSRAPANGLRVCDVVWYE